MTDTERLIHAYYDAFNAGDMEGFLGLMTDDVLHDVSQGGRQKGRAAFATFMGHMNHCYREQIEDIVVMVDPTGTRAAAEFMVRGIYLQTDRGVPPDTAEARGQTYMLPAGAFFEVRDGRVARISNHYNLGDWVRQVNQPAP